MTKEEAMVEARLRWGGRGFAHDAHKAPAAVRFEVGVIKGTFPKVLGRGPTWEAAIEAADAEAR